MRDNKENFRIKFAEKSLAQVMLLVPILTFFYTTNEAEGSNVKIIGCINEKNKGCTTKRIKLPPLKLPPLNNDKTVVENESNKDNVVETDSCNDGKPSILNIAKDIKKEITMSLEKILEILTSEDDKKKVESFMKQSTELDVTSNDAIIGIKKYMNILLPFLHEDLLNKMRNTDYESEIAKVIRDFCNKLVYFFCTVDDLKRYDNARKEEEENLKKIEKEKRDVGLTAESLFKLSIELLSDMRKFTHCAPIYQEIENCLTVESFKKSPIDMVKLIDSTAEQLWGKLYRTGNMPTAYFAGYNKEVVPYNKLKIIRPQLICFSIKQALENQAKLKITSENMKCDIKIFNECREIIDKLIYAFMPNMLSDKDGSILMSVKNDFKLMEETFNITLLLKITYNLHALMQCVRQELIDSDEDTGNARNLLNNLNLKVVNLAQQFVATDNEVPNYLITSEIQNALNSINNGKYLILDDKRILKNLGCKLLSYLKRFSKNDKSAVKPIRKCKNVQPLRKNEARAAWRCKN